MMNSGLAAVIHWARASSGSSRRASRGTKTMIRTTPATAAGGTGRWPGPVCRASDPHHATNSPQNRAVGVSVSTR